MGPDPDPAAAAPREEESAPTPPPAPLLRLRDGLPAVVETDGQLADAAAALAAGAGPVAIDAERASGYRYSARAYLIQLRRAGSGTILVDPVALSSLDPLVAALDGTEWILHAATQDLPCLTDLGLHPAALFDTELAGRLLGHPRVGLATLVESLLGYRMAKEHSAVDWSTRPLPRPWLEYAALDVEVLIELRDVLATELDQAGKTEWAAEEFDWLRGFALVPRVDAWRRTSGLHKVRGRRGLGAVRALWEERDRIAAERDVTPSRILPDSAIVAAAQALPTTRARLMATPGFFGRGAERYAARWVDALTQVLALPERDLPTRSAASDGPPPPRAWADKDPVAGRRLVLARDAMSALAEETGVPAENLVTPDFLRRVLWTPPRTRDETLLAEAVTSRFTELGARPWQIGLVVPVVVRAVLGAEQEPASELDRAPATATDPAAPGRARDSGTTSR